MVKLRHMLSAVAFLLCFLASQLNADTYTQLEVCLTPNSALNCPTFFPDLDSAFEYFSTQTADATLQTCKTFYLPDKKISNFSAFGLVLTNQERAIVPKISFDKDANPVNFLCEVGSQASVTSNSITCFDTFLSNLCQVTLTTNKLSDVGLETCQQP